MRISVIQLTVDEGDPLAYRVERAADLVREQAGADLVVLPELWAHGAWAVDRWAEEAEPLDGPTVKALRAAAVDVGSTVHMGSIIERATDGRLYNTSLLLGADGEVRATYRKIHLFGFTGGEASRIDAGDEVVVHDGLGLATCYDLRFPELFRALVDRGAEVLVIPASWPAARVGHWRLLAQARAVEDQCLLVACAAVGTHAGVTLGGHSMVVDPWGEVLAEAGGEPQVLTVNVDRNVVERTREQFPVLRDRRLG